MFTRMTAAAFCTLGALNAGEPEPLPLTEQVFLNLSALTQAEMDRISSSDQKELARFLFAAEDGLDTDEINASIEDLFRLHNVKEWSIAGYFEIKKQVRFLVGNPHLEYLGLGRNWMESSQVLHLAPNWPELKRLELVRQDGVVDLLNGLTQLEAIELRHSLDADGVPDFWQAIADHPNLKELWVEEAQTPATIWNATTPLPLEKLVICLGYYRTPEDVAAMTEFFRHTPELRDLKLVRQAFYKGVDGVEELFAQIRDLPQLEEIEICSGYAEGDIDRADAIRQVLANDSLKRFTLTEWIDELGEIGPELVEAKLTHLSLGLIFGGGENYVRLIKGLEGNPHLESLELSYVRTTEAGEQKLPAALTHLLIVSPNLKELKVPRLPGLNDRSAASLIGCVASQGRFANLTHFDLSGCPLGSMSAAALVDLLEEVSHFESLQLSRCQLGADAVEALVAAIEEHPSLKKCTLGGNALGEIAFTKRCEALVERMVQLEQERGIDFGLDFEALTNKEYANQKAVWY